MSHTDYPSINTDKAPDLIPPRFRSALYLYAAIVGAGAFIITGLAPVWFAPATADAVIETVRVIGGGFAVFAGSVGFAYRPTR